MPNKIVKRANKQVAGLMSSAETTKLEQARLAEVYKGYEAGIREVMEEKGVAEYVLDDKPEEPKVLSASLYTRTSVNYDLEKIKSKLSKQQLKEVSDSMMVAEQEGLRLFIKNHPELRKELKQFVQKVTVINERKLALALEYGIIKVDDIKDCYSTKETEVFKLQRKKRFELLDD